MLIICLLLSGAFKFSFPGGSAAAMLSGTGNPAVGNAVTTNPALLSSISTSGVNIAYCTPYGINDIHHSQLELGLRSLAAGGKLSWLSSNGYSELCLSLDKAWAVTEGVGLGVRLAGCYQALAGEAEEFVPSISAGVAWQKPNYGLGGAILNLNHPALPQGTPIPAEFRIGGTLLPVPELRISADWVSRELSSGAGIDVSFVAHRALTMSLGVATNPLRYAGGITCCIQSLTVNYSYMFHPVLKETSVFGVGYNF